MAAVGQKLELGLVRRGIGHLGTVYRSPTMHDLSPEEKLPKAESQTSTIAPAPWFNAREAARGWGFLAAFAASLYVAYRAIAWLMSTLLA